MHLRVVLTGMPNGLRSGTVNDEVLGGFGGEGFSAERRGCSVGGMSERTRRVSVTRCLTMNCVPS